MSAHFWMMAVLAMTIAVDVVALVVVGLALRQSVLNLATVQALGLTNGRTLVARGLVFRTSAQLLLVLVLTAASTLRLLSLPEVPTAETLSVFSLMLMAQLLIATMALYDAYERAALNRKWEASREVEDGVTGHR